MQAGTDTTIKAVTEPHLAEPGHFDADARAWVDSFGSHSVTAQLAQAGTRLWRPQGVARAANEGAGGPAGFVAYTEAAGTWIAAGPPVGPAHAREQLVQGFIAAAAQRGRRAVFFAMEAQLARACHLDWLRCGEEPLWRAAEWRAPNARPEAFRQARRAQRRGVRVNFVGPTAALPAHLHPEALENLLRRWQAGQSLAPLGFVARASLHHHSPEARRWFACVDATPVAAAVALPNGPGGTWLIEQLIRDPNAPNGSIELLVDAAMGHIAEQAPQAWVSLGVVALAGEVSWPLRLSRALGRDLYPFAGLVQFRRKLQPTRTADLGLAFASDVGPRRATWALLCAFAQNRPGRFAWRTLGQGPRPVLAAMAASLLPWTAALALAPASFFGAPANQAAWVLFDVALFLALARLALRPTATLARALCWVVGLDAGLTALEFALAPGPQYWPWALNVATKLVATGAPALSCWVLAGAAGRLGRRRAGQKMPGSATTPR